MRAHRFNTPRVVVALALALAITAHARVHVRWPGSAGLDAAFDALGGTPLYASRITLNAGVGDLRVVGFHQSLESVCASLRQALPAATLTSGSQMASGVVTSSQSVIRLVLVQPGADESTVAFAIHLSPAEAALAAVPPSWPTFAGVPPIASATTTFLARDTEARAEFGVATAPIAPEEAAAHYREGLSAAGWQDLLTPPRREDAQPPPRAPGFVACGRGDELCFVLVTEAAAPGHATITLLHKRMGVK